MADIKIYGKLVNDTPENVIADASQILDGDISVSEALAGKCGAFVWAEGVTRPQNSLVSHDGVLYLVTAEAGASSEPTSDNTDYRALTDKTPPYEQTAGDSTTTAMSQKAVTDAIEAESAARTSALTAVGAELERVGYGCDTAPNAIDGVFEHPGQKQWSCLMDFHTQPGDSIFVSMYIDSSDVGYAAISVGLFDAGGNLLQTLVDRDWFGKTGIGQKKEHTVEATAAASRIGLMSTDAGMIAFTATNTTHPMYSDKQVQAAQTAEFAQSHASLDSDMAALADADACLSKGVAKALADTASLGADDYTLVTANNMVKAESRPFTVEVDTVIEVAAPYVILGYKIEHDGVTVFDGLKATHIFLDSLAVLGGSTVTMRVGIEGGDVTDLAEVAAAVTMGTPLGGKAPREQWQAELGYETMEPIDMEPYRHIALGNVGDTPTMERTAKKEFKCAVVDCAEGEVYTIHALKRAYPTRLWAVLDSEGTIIAGQSSLDSIQPGIADVEVTIPRGGARLVINIQHVNTTGSNMILHGYAYKGRSQAAKSQAEIAGIKEAAAWHDEHRMQVTYDIDSQLCAMIRGYGFADALDSPMCNLMSAEHLAGHVASFVIKDGIVYSIFFVNRHTEGAETPAEMDISFQYFPLSDPAGITHVDVCKIGDMIDGKAVVKCYDSLIAISGGTLYLIWTSELDGDGYYTLFYRTWDIAAGTMSAVGKCRWKVGETETEMTLPNVKAALAAEGVPYPGGQNQMIIMPKFSDYNGEHYTGMGVEGLFNCIVKTSDYITYEYVSQPPMEQRANYEPCCHVVGSVLYYMCRQNEWDNNARGTCFFAKYNLARNFWYKDTAYFSDTQSRPDMFVYNNQLYAVHAPQDRSHIAIMRVNTLTPGRSEYVQVAKTANQYFYPFVRVYDGHLYITYTHNRRQILFNEFILDGTGMDTILARLRPLLTQ